MKDVIIIRDRGQLTIPDSIRKVIYWAAPMSAVTISVVRPDEIVIRPHQSKVNTNEIWNKIKNSRSILGKGNVSASKFLDQDRQR